MSDTFGCFDRILACDRQIEKYTDRIPACDRQIEKYTDRIPACDRQIEKYTTEYWHVTDR